MIWQDINNPEIEVYVATNMGQIVGFMTYGKSYKPFKDFQQEIGMFYILKEYQRQGIGRTFFDIARSQAAKNGHDKFCVAVNKKNYEALKFYVRAVLKKALHFCNTNKWSAQFNGLRG